MFEILYYIIISPILLIVATYFLWQELGVSSIAGIGVMVFCILICVMIEKVFAHLRYKDFVYFKFF